MRLHDLIFSSRPVYRIPRHLLFWVARFFLIFLFSYGTTLFNFLASGEARHIDGLNECCQIGGIRLGIDIFYSYAVIYWVLPRYFFKKRFVAGGLLLAALTLLSFGATAFTIIEYYNVLELPGNKLGSTIWLQTIHFMLGGSPVVCATLLALRTLRIWYLKEEEKITITRENASAELQLLKAQIHPHFLFNTLNNIYAYTLSGHPHAAILAERLSGMMDYMDREGEKDLVPVEKEIQLIRDYMSLEKIRYNERLDIDIQVSGDFRNKLIAPLLMIPFTENCFKHGASAMRGKQWVSLRIEARGNRLIFDLRNSKPVEPPTIKTPNGIGLKNVQKRLELIYPGSHLLRTEPADNSFCVYLEVALEEIQTLAPAESPVRQSQSLSYA